VLIISISGLIEVEMKDVDRSPFSIPGLKKVAAVIVELSCPISGLGEIGVAIIWLSFPVGVMIAELSFWTSDLSEVEVMIDTLSVVITSGLKEVVIVAVEISFGISGLGEDKVVFVAPLKV